jgi:hypothetical protein
MATGEAAGKPGEAEEMTGVAEKKPGVAAVTIRKCETLAEMHACFALQKEVWKFADAELVPVRIFVVAEKIGGQVIGAFIPGNRADGNDELIGFALRFLECATVILTCTRRCWPSASSIAIEDWDAASSSISVKMRWPAAST